MSTWSCDGFRDGHLIPPGSVGAHSRNFSIANWVAGVVVEEGSSLDSGATSLENVVFKSGCNGGHLDIRTEQSRNGTERRMLIV